MFEQLLQRRLAHEPVAYIIGEKEFWSRRFQVGPGALVPRPETETLVEEAVRALPGRGGRHRVLDLGSGTACLLVAVLKEYPNATGIGVDSSKDALQWARRNIVRHGLESRAALIEGGWDSAQGTFDLILCNPPYIPSGDIPGLPLDVGDYEPCVALDGGPDGLDAYRALVPVLRKRLASDGVALLEIGAGQHHIVKQIIEAEGLRVPKIAPDLAGIPRSVVVSQA